MIRLTVKAYEDNDVRVNGHFKGTCAYEVISAIAYLVSLIHKNQEDLSDKELYSEVKKMVKEWDKEVLNKGENKDDRNSKE